MCCQQSSSKDTGRASDDTIPLSGGAWWKSVGASKPSPKRRRIEDAIRSRVKLQAPGDAKNSPLEITSLSAPENLSIDAEPIVSQEEVTVQDQSDAGGNSQTPDVILIALKAQYREALYISKTSLAYFAKGPLARARALFFEGVGSLWSQIRLIEQLSTSLLPIAIIDKKYREGVQQTVRDLPAVVHDSDEGECYLSPLRKRSRKSKKDKVGKLGLYPGEEVDVAKWWLASRSCDPSESEISNQEDLMRSRISKLRTRETQAQILLALEILVLKQRKVPERGPSDFENLTSEHEKKKEKGKRAKKQLDPRTLIDMMLDRLSIWQSMAVEEKARVPQSKAKGLHPAVGNGSEASPEELKNFCIDVIVPFYSSRLPDLSSTICKKLGAAMPPTPVRPPTRNPLHGLKSEGVKPGAAIARPPPAKRARKTLERVLTDSQKPSLARSRSQSLSAPLSLHRSNSEVILPSVKREVSDQSLASIPLNRVPSIHVQKRYSQREVDLCSAAAVTEAKLKRKAAVEQELKGAIAAMKKPNARMAVKELVEASERRKDGLEKRGKRKGEPIRNPFAQGPGVQVMATPMKNRSRNALQRPGLPRMAASQPVLGHQLLDEHDEIEEIPQSSAGRVPESTLKQPVRRGLHRRDVEQTPTRGCSKFTEMVEPQSSIRGSLQRSFTTSSLVQQDQRASHPASTELKRPSLPTMQPVSSLPTFATPTKPVHRDAQAITTMAPMISSDAIGETPQKSRTEVLDHSVAAESQVEKTIMMGSSPPIPNFSNRMEEEGEKDIYAALGWDNDDDELI